MNECARPSVSVWGCEWNAVASQPRETLKREREREIYSGGAYCSLLKVNHVRGAFRVRRRAADKDAEEEEGEKQQQQQEKRNTT